jgi:hypothetical protein
MSDFQDAFTLMLSCSLCGTYYGYADLVVACEQADAAAVADTCQAAEAYRKRRGGP